MTKRIFVSSRLRGSTKKEFDKHVEEAKRFSRFVVNAGYGAPFTPHLLYPLFLDDDKHVERELGIKASSAYLDVCDMLFAFVNKDEYVSDGMRSEIRRAVKQHIPVYIFKSINGSIEPCNGLMDIWSMTWLKGIR